MMGVTRQWLILVVFLSPVHRRQHSSAVSAFPFPHTAGWGGKHTHMCITHNKQLSAATGKSSLLEDEATSRVSTPEDVSKLTRQALHSIEGEDYDLATGALTLLRDACLCRQAFEFSPPPPSSNRTPFLRHIPSLVPDCQHIQQAVVRMRNNDWLSTNPDSVDGIPSYHLNLISGGCDVAPCDDDDDFSNALCHLTSLVRPYVYDHLLPLLQKDFNDETLVVDDVFVRCYGQDILGTTDDESTNERTGISAHYDVSSRLTAVVALDDVAATGRNGLYTVDTDCCNNHSALRRFFPLARGDAVAHSWDVLHGVDVESGLKRSSLIVWFDVAKKESREDVDTSSPVAPWISKRARSENDHVAQFVYASAVESSSNADDANLRQQCQDMYLQSASNENPFGLTRVASLLADGDFALTDWASSVIDDVAPLSTLPVALQKVVHVMDNSVDQLALRFWFEGAVRGNHVAQEALGNDVMEKLSTKTIVLGQSSDVDALLQLIVVLFSLAAQQGSASAMKALQQVVPLALSRQGSVSNKTDLEQSGVMRIVRSALHVE